MTCVVSMKPPPCGVSGDGVCENPQCNFDNDCKDIKDCSLFPELAMEWTARVQPLLQLTHVAHDLDEVSAKSSTGLMGVNFWHSKALRLALNLESTSHEGKVAGSKSRHDFGAFEALYLF